MVMLIGMDSWLCGDVFVIWFIWFHFIFRRRHVVVVVVAVAVYCCSHRSFFLIFVTLFFRFYYSFLVHIGLLLFLFRNGRVGLTNDVLNSASQSSMPSQLPRTVIQSAIPLARGLYLFVPFVCWIKRSAVPWAQGPFVPTICWMNRISCSFRTMIRLILDLFFSNLYRIQSCLPHCIIIGSTSFIASIIDYLHLTLLFSIIFTRISVLYILNNRVEIMLVNFTS
jgi:hypothetical protein